MRRSRALLHVKSNPDVAAAANHGDRFKAAPERLRSVRPFAVRRVQASDMEGVITLDGRVTGLVKPEYWHDVFERYGKRRLHERMFLVAQQQSPEALPAILGFVVGEVRAWEFGSEPCGWVLALSVEPRLRLRGTGQALLEALAIEFKKAGVSKMRTMVARDNRLHLLFFRSEGMMAGPYIQLEKDLD